MNTYKQPQAEHFHYSPPISGSIYPSKDLMGGCLSSGSADLPTAKLVTVEEDAGGLIKEFPEHVKVAEILRERPGFFVCHADSMHYDEYVSPLSADQELQAEHLYFLLPVTALRHPLPVSDMATLAVKASAAMERSRRRYKIMPSTTMMRKVSDISQHELISSSSSWRGEFTGEGYNSETLEWKRVDLGLKVRPVRYKMQRIASGGKRVNGSFNEPWRRKLPNGSFHGPWRRKLPTIYEEGFHSLIHLT